MTIQYAPVNVRPHTSCTNILIDAIFYVNNGSLCRSVLSTYFAPQQTVSLVRGDCSTLFRQMGDFPVVWDNGASCHMSHSSTGWINYHEAYATIPTASGKRYPIEDYGNLPAAFRSSSGEVPLLLCDIAHFTKPQLQPFFLSELQPTTGIPTPENKTV